ncbi:hypothetical protein GCM10028798_02220 [Humibacter antri]
MAWFQGFAISWVLLLYALFIALGVWVAFLVIRAAVRSAMDDHYRKVQWYEQTGLWYSARPPKGLPGAAPLSRADEKNLPKPARPE